MRGAIPELASPFPLIHRLPAVLQDDDFLRRFLSGFDEALAPIFLSLDTLSCYVDPELAPADFLDWLAQWVGIEFEDGWSLEQRREMVAGAVRMHQRRGTAAGIADALRLVVAGEITITESGAAAWSGQHGGELPGEASPRLHVRVRPAAEARIDLARLEAVVAAVKPAHIPHTVELVED